MEQKKENINENNQKEQRKLYEAIRKKFIEEALEDIEKKKAEKENLKDDLNNITFITFKGDFKELIKEPSLLQVIK